MTEYKVVSSAGLPTEIQLNDLAKDGWDVVQIVHNLISRDRYEYAVYLKRRELEDANCLS
jgi:hypothetical protein